MFNKFNVYVEKTREKIIGPREVIFENGIKFVTRINEDNPALEFLKNGKEIFDLTSTAPPDTKILLSDSGEWEASIVNQEIKIGYFKGVDYILSFLHEAGHLHNIADSEIAGDAKIKHAREVFRDKDNGYPNSRLLALKNEREAVMVSERSAWAFALKQARRIEKELNIKILSKIGDIKDIREYSRKYLKTYKKDYMDQLYDLDIHSDEQMHTLFQNLSKS
jgi:hypothetical protein